MLRILLACMLALLTSLTLADDLPLPGDAAPVSSKARAQKPSKPHASVASHGKRHAGKHLGKRTHKRGKGKAVAHGRRHMGKVVSGKGRQHAHSARKASIRHAGKKAVAQQKHTKHAAKHGRKAGHHKGKVSQQKTTHKAGKAAHKHGAQSRKVSKHAGKPARSARATHPKKPTRHRTHHR